MSRYRLTDTESPKIWGAERRSVRNVDPVVNEGNMGNADGPFTARRDTAFHNLHGRGARIITQRRFGSLLAAGHIDIGSAEATVETTAR